ncbi:MAG: hypothetical protein AABX48_00615 [Nanoarchaeota archaeon]
MPLEKKDSIETKFNSDGSISVQVQQFILDMKTFNWGRQYSYKENGVYILIDDLFRDNKSKEVRGRNLNSFLADRFMKEFWERYLTHHHNEEKVGRKILADYPIHMEQWHFEGEVYLRSE